MKLLVACDHVRGEWLQATVRHLQVVGPIREVVDVAAVVERFLDDSPPPAVGAESLILRSLLIELCLEIGHQAHHRVHEGSARCTFQEASILRQVWSNKSAEPRGLLRAWSRCFRESLLLRHHVSVVAEMKQWIERHADERLNLQPMAARFRRSPAALIRAFRKECVVTPGRYQRDIRLRLATEMLRKGDIKIEAIALIVGYGGKKSLYRAFRGANCMLPSRLRHRTAS
jgi:methylphosphotriester-DNA--protein-cysteine methyltransferase